MTLRTPGFSKLESICLTKQTSVGKDPTRCKLFHFLPMAQISRRSDLKRGRWPSKSEKLPHICSLYLISRAGVHHKILGGTV